MRVTLREAFFQPLGSLVRIARNRERHGNENRLDVALARQRLQLPGYFEHGALETEVRVVAIDGIDHAGYPHRDRVVIPGRLDRGIEPAQPEIGMQEHAVTESESRDLGVNPVERLHGLLVACGQVQLRAAQTLYKGVERIEFDRPQDIQLAFLPAQLLGEEMRIEHVCFRVVGIQLNRTTERGVGGIPVVVVQPVAQRQAEVHLGEVGIDRQRLELVSTAFGIALHRHAHSELHLEPARAAQAPVRQGAVAIETQRAREKTFGKLHVPRRDHFEMKHAPEVRLVSRGIDDSRARQQLRLLPGQGDLHGIGDRPGDLALHDQDVAELAVVGLGP